MFVIFRVGPKEKVKATGIFVCPKCSIKREYKVKSSIQYFRLFFIPLFPTVKKMILMLNVKAIKELITLMF